MRNEFKKGKPCQWGRLNSRLLPLMIRCLFREVAESWPSTRTGLTGLTGMTGNTETTTQAASKTAMIIISNLGINSLFG